MGRVLVVADSDTRWKWALAVGRSLTEESALSGLIVETLAMPSARQLAEIGAFGGELRSSSIGALRSAPDLLDYDAIVVGLPGSGIYAVIAAVHDRVATERPERRPVIVTGYVGVVYERYLDGFLWRVGADVICCNSRADLELFSGFAETLGFDTDPLVQTGYPIIPRGRSGRDRSHAAGPSTLTFVVQPTVPPRLEERLYVLRRLVEYATRHADRRVIVKLRARRGEQTTHVEQFHFEDLLPMLDLPTPPNLSLEYGRMDEVLDRTDLCVTVSSTAALESLARDIPTAVLTDFGIKEILGNHYFLGSGCFATMDQLIDDVVPAADPAWLARNGLGDEDSVTSAANRVAALLETQRTNPGPLPVFERYYTSERAPFIAQEASDVANWERSRTSGTLARRGKSVIRRVIRGPAYRGYRKLARWANSG